MEPAVRKVPRLYRVMRVAQPPGINGVWDKTPWTGLRPGAVALHMGAEPAHRPRTRFKIAYDEANVYVIFRVEDRYVRAVTDRLHGPVCADSCVEFFFTPGPDVAAGYFNLETNCGGAMLFGYQPAPEKAGDCMVPPEKAARIELAHSMPGIVEPEVAEPTTWTIEYRLPAAILEEYCPVTPPSPGTVWRANLYKCADNSSHPHWLTWSPVDNPYPRFHLPRFFGRLQFE